MNQDPFDGPKRQGKLCGYDKHGVPVYHGDELICINQNSYFSKNLIKAYYSFDYTDININNNLISIRIVNYKYNYSIEDCHSDGFSTFIKKPKEPFTDEEYKEFFI